MTQRAGEEDRLREVRERSDRVVRRCQDMNSARESGVLRRGGKVVTELTVGYRDGKENRKERQS